MSRLFLSLFAVIVVVLMAFIINAGAVVQFLFSSVVEGLREQQIGGIITQLNEEIHGLDAQQRERRIAEIQALFRYDVSLHHIDDLAISTAKQQRLHQGEFVNDMVEQAEFVYHRSGLTGKAWRLQLDPTQEDMTRDFLSGPIALLKQKLAVAPPEQWSQRVQALDRQFGIPISLIDRAMLDQQTELQPQQHEALLAGEMVLLYRQGKDEIELIYQRIEDSDYFLKIGKMDVPFLLNNINTIVLSLLALLLGVAIWLWLRPVWQDLRKLQQASEGFGQGELTTRIKVSRYSFIKSILHAFNGMAQRIEQLITSHKTLTNAVSHELRTPVSRLRFSMEMLEKTESETDRKRYLQAMNTDIGELDEMLAALLNYARMDRQRDGIKKTALVPEVWLQEQVELAQSHCGRVKLSVDCCDLPTASVAIMDDKLMARALQNLLQNACRYAKQHIHVSFRYRDGRYVLEVDDDGSGIPESEWQRLFDPFTRVDESRDRDSGGYGLGLAIVRQVAQLHQGEVAIEPSLLGGARFVIRWA